MIPLQLIPEHTITQYTLHKHEKRMYVYVKMQCYIYAPSPGRCGLLGPGTILAHCVHLSTAEVELLRATGAGVSHCPNSNFTLKSGVCDVQRLKKAGVKVWIHSVIIASRLFILFNTC